MRTIPWLALLGCALCGCAALGGNHPYVSDVPGLPEERLLAGSEEPVLFLGAERDAPAVGYASADLVVRIAGPRKAGRVPVRVLGPIEVQAHVPAKLLSLRVQRRGRLRDTPIYVGPNDRVRVLGPAAEAGRVRVAATPLLIGFGSTPYEGSYPVQGLGTQPAPATALPIEAGAAYELAAGLPFSLFDAPNGTVILPPKVSPLATDVTVLRQDGDWFAVRVGYGPYLVGYTRSQIKPRAQSAAHHAPRHKSAQPAAGADAIPARLLHEAGALKRVAAGTRLFFNDTPFAVLRKEAWARVLAEYPNGEVDAFVAVDDGVAVRALLARSALREPPAPATGSATPAPGPAALPASPASGTPTATAKP